MAVPLRLLKLVGSRVPLILKTTLFHSLSLTEESGVWDLRTALIVNTLRSIMTESTSSLERQQRFTLRDPGIDASTWISKVTLPAPEDDIRQLVFKAIDDLKDCDSISYSKPRLTPVEAEWTGFRTAVDDPASQSTDLSEEQKYDRLMGEVSSDVVVLYFHGGAYYLMDPSSHRTTNSRLAKLTKGRTLSVRYRLAPQEPFPAAFIDCIVAYLSLLYPGEGSIHSAIRPEHIVFAGDSAGGNMSFALLLFILHLQRSGQARVQFHGRMVDVPLPAGVATNSAWLDMTRSMPSIISNAHYDYLPPPFTRLGPDDPRPSMPEPCSIWPSSPPRASIYCDDSLMCHPLVSPLAAPTEMWSGACPVYLCVGEEMLEDEVRILAQRCHKADVPVCFELYEAMPHCFAMLLDWRSPRSSRCFQGWAGFISSAVDFAERSSEESAADLNGGHWIEFKTGEEIELDLNDLARLSDTEVTKLMQDERDRLKKWIETISSNIGSKL